MSCAVHDQYAAALILYVVVSAAVVLVLAQVRGQGAWGPDQPIDFSHPIHVTTVGLDCEHCHQTADRSRQVRCRKRNSDGASDR